MTAQWYQELSDEAADASGAVPYSAAWWVVFRDRYLARFPEADPRSKANIIELADRAAAKEGLTVQPSLEFHGLGTVA